jgi:hypothetical protein
MLRIPSTTKFSIQRNYSIGCIFVCRRQLFFRLGGTPYLQRLVTVLTVLTLVTGQGHQMGQLKESSILLYPLVRLS